MGYNFNVHIKKKNLNIFGGSERKETVTLDDGNIYLLKLPDPIRELHRDISYINNSISEYIACKIFKSMGLSVQDVLLGEYTTKNSKGENKTYIACACKNIVPSGFYLSEADKASLGSDHQLEGAQKPSFETAELISEIAQNVSREKLMRFYSDLFVADALIANPDRHNGNWGFLTDLTVEFIAPIYDCGSSLCPLFNDQELGTTVIKDNVANAQSAILNSKGERIKYMSYLYSCENDSVNEALKRIIPKIDLKEVCKIVDETPYISEVRKNFYKELLSERFSLVLLPALEQVFFRDVSPGNTVTQKELYDFYKSNIEFFSGLNVGEKATITVNGREVEAKRVTNKYVLLTNPIIEEAEAIFSIRSSNRDLRKTMANLFSLYGKDFIFGKSLKLKHESLVNQIHSAQLRSSAQQPSQGQIPKSFER